MRFALGVLLVLLSTATACVAPPHQASSTADAPKSIVDGGGP